jgi:bacterioferritin
VEGSPTIIELLNEVLTAELTAINQYFVHARMCESWGYERLADKVRDESIEEMRQAEELVDRILFLDGVPNLQRLGTVMVGETVPEQVHLDLEVERTAIERLTRGIATCTSEGDHGSRHLLEKILGEEEDHADWLESQLELIRQLGEAHYLSQQVRR